MLTNPICKINIGLYVTDKRPDGYHNLQTVFYPVPLCDNLEVNPLAHSTKPYELHLTGNTIPGDDNDNLVVRVLNDLRKDFDIPPVEIWLHKRIPSGAGLGGGSSDAAYMMLMLREMFSLELSDTQLEEKLSKLGADCPFFVKSVPQFAEGIGEKLMPCSLSLKGWYFALIKPEIFVSTREAFGGITCRQPIHDLRTAITTPVECWRDTISNDFETTVFDKYPRIKAIKQTLYDMGAVYASMSGSGSSVYALFDRPVDETLPKVFKDCFTYHCKLLK